MKLEHKEAIDQARMMGIPPHQLASNLICRDLVEVSLKIMRDNKQPFGKLSESQQQQVIDRLSDTVKEAVDSAVLIISARGAKAVPINVKSVVCQKNLRVVGDVDGDDPSRHDLTDAVGSLCLLVIAPSDYAEALDSNRPEKDQNDLPLFEQGSDTPNPRSSDPHPSEIQQEFLGGDQEPVELTPLAKAEAFVRAGGNITPSAIQKTLGCKKKEAADIILQLAEAGVVSDPDDDGIRNVINLSADAQAQIESPTAEPSSDDVEQFDENAYADAVLLVQREKRVSVSFLQSEMGVSESMANRMIKQMELDGLVSEENDMGGRAVFD